MSRAPILIPMEDAPVALRLCRNLDCTVETIGDEPDSETQLLVVSFDRIRDEAFFKRRFAKKLGKHSP